MIHAQRCFDFWNRDCSFGFPGTIQINPVLSPCSRSQYILQNSSSCNLYTQQTFQIFSHSGHVHTYISITIKYYIITYRYHISLESNQKALFWGCKLPSMKHVSFCSTGLCLGICCQTQAHHTPRSLCEARCLGWSAWGNRSRPYCRLWLIGWLVGHLQKSEWLDYR